MSPTTRVTVVIPTCARPALLSRALASVRAQDLAPLEVIVVDDGAGDCEIVTERVRDAQLSAARVLANRGTKGASGARNTGAATASASFIAFLDDDDEWLPSYLREVAQMLDTGEIDVICADFWYRYDDGRERPGKDAPASLVAPRFFTRNPGLIGSNLVIRRTLYSQMGGFDETLPTFEDMDFGIRLSLVRARYAALRHRLVRHHQHSQARLCTHRGDPMREGVRRFFELHGGRMNAAERDKYRREARWLWGVDEYGRDESTKPALS